MPMIRSEIRIALAVLVLCLGLSTVDAWANSSLRACAARDRQVLMMIEESETTNRLEASAASRIMLTLTTARMTCYEGHPLDAMALYDAIAEKISTAASSVFDRRSH